AWPNMVSRNEPQPDREDQPTRYQSQPSRARARRSPPSSARRRPILQRRGVSVPAFAGATTAVDHRGLLISVLLAQSPPSSDVVVHEKAVRQSAIELRAHEADVNIPLRCKLPVDNTRNRVQRTGALRVLFAIAGHDAGGRAEVGMLGVMVISGDHIHLVGNGVFDAGPIDVENPVS